jgi:tetratricopeptide (TPR) repeat protein
MIRISKIAKLNPNLVAAAGRNRQARMPYLIVLITAFVLLSSQIASAQHIQIPQGELGQKIELAWSYFHDGDYEGAVDILHTLLKDNPENPLVEHTLGYLYIKDRDWDKAAKYLQDSLVHTVDEKVNLWNHIYLAEIFKQKGFFKKATGHLDFVQAHDLSTHMVKRVAKIRMDIRVMKLLDSNVVVGHVLIRYPHYLLPREQVEEMGAQLVSDWKRIAAFLNLSGDEKIEVFVYPSQRLMEKFYPAELNLQAEDYSFDQIHTLFHGEGDYLSALAPYAYHRLCKKYNRYGASLWFIGGLDDAIRETYNDIPLNSWVSELYNQDKLPELMFLVDDKYTKRMPSGIKDPSGGSFILFLKDKFHPNDFLYILAEPNLEFNFDTTLEEIETQWIRHLRSGRSLLENKAHVAELVGKVEKFISPPVVGKDLMDDLKKAATLNDLGKKEDALDKVESILHEEPRYGDALYLKGKILYDNNKLMDSFDVFLEAVKYIPPDKISYGWACFFLARIAKLKENYIDARNFYARASKYALPPETLEDCQTNLFKLEKYLAIRPQASAVVSDKDIMGIKSFLQYVDDILRARDWIQFRDLTAFSLNQQAIINLESWYQNPIRFKDNVVYTHELVKAEVEMNTAKLQVILRVEYPEIEDDELDEDTNLVDELKPKVTKQTKRSREYTRFFLLTRLPEGWRILDYFDQHDLYW